MSILVRKINRAKWPQENLGTTIDIPADAITGCLRTQQNTLSVWEIPTQDDLGEAVLAIAASLDHLESLDVIMLDSEFLISANIDISNTPGNTKVNDLVDTHKDLSNLTYSKLGIISTHIVDRIHADQLRRFTKKSLKDILNKAIEEQRLNRDDLKEYIKGNL
jgi:hypothetical protein